MRLARYGLAIATLAAALLLLVAVRERINLTTSALGLVLVVTVVAVRWGSGPALAIAVLAGLSFNFFFIPPLHTFTIHGLENWIAFGVFLITAVTVGQLSYRAQKKAAEAEARREKIESLYEQLQRAMEEATQAESLRRSEQLKSALLEAVTHDLRTPLTSIKASVTALLDTSGEPGSLGAEGERELLQVIEEECDRLNRFVEEMMTLARIEGGQLLLHRAAASAEEVIEAAVQRADALLRPLSLEISIAGQLPVLLVDAQAISGVVYELLENAAKYGPPGSAVRVYAQQASPGYVEIAVEDEGPGVPEIYRERVLEKFFRAPGLPRDKRGFGVGLAIARGIVEAHGGRIAVEAAGRHTGAIVRFTVPCQTNA